MHADKFHTAVNDGDEETLCYLINKHIFSNIMQRLPSNVCVRYCMFMPFTCLIVNRFEFRAKQIRIVFSLVVIKFLTSRYV